MPKLSRPNIQKIKKMFKKIKFSKKSQKGGVKRKEHDDKVIKILQKHVKESALC